jgi:hypothetical protein
MPAEIFRAASSVSGSATRLAGATSLPNPLCVLLLRPGVPPLVLRHHEKDRGNMA